MPHWSLSLFIHSSFTAIVRRHISIASGHFAPVYRLPPGSFSGRREHVRHFIDLPDCRRTKANDGGQCHQYPQRDKHQSNAAPRPNADDQAHRSGQQPAFLQQRLEHMHGQAGRQGRSRNGRQIKRHSLDSEAAALQSGWRLCSAR